MFWKDIFTVDDYTFIPHEMLELNSGLQRPGHRTVSPVPFGSDASDSHLQDVDFTGDALDFLRREQY